MNERYGKPARFAGIGLINTGVDAAVFTALLALFGFSLLWANVAAWAVAVSGSYVMNGVITFGRSLRQLANLKDYAKFAAAGAIAGAAATLVLLIAANWLPVWLSKGIAIGASFVVNYYLANRHVFPDRDQA